MAIAPTILTQDLADELTLVDAKEDKLRGEMLDLQHAAAFLPRTKIQAFVDYAATANSDLCIVTAGARQNPGESRLNLLQRNVALFRHIVPPLAEHSPDCIIMVVSSRFCLDCGDPPEIGVKNDLERSRPPGPR